MIKPNSMSPHLPTYYMLLLSTFSHYAKFYCIYLLLKYYMLVLKLFATNMKFKGSFK